MKKIVHLLFALSFFSHAQITTPIFTSSASAVTVEDSATSVAVLDVNATDGAGGTDNDTNVTYASPSISSPN